ncbi:hypothetical protein D8M38_09860 [Kocuria sp. HSID17582]|nr:hypothetical protein D8M38_09860 [Kocuria sp. HSID17582]
MSSMARTTAPGEPFDAVVLAMELTRRTDERAQRLLEALRPAAGLYVMDEMLDPVGAEEHDVAHGVVDFALTGGGARTDSRFRELLAASGYEVASRRNVGWSGQLYTAHPTGGAGRTA